MIEEDPQLRAKYEHLKKEYRARSKELEDTKMENTLFKRLEHKRNAEQRVSEEELRYGYEKKIQQLSTVVEEKGSAAYTTLSSTTFDFCKCMLMVVSCSSCARFEIESSPGASPSPRPAAACS